MAKLAMLLIAATLLLGLFTGLTLKSQVQSAMLSHISAIR